MKFVNDCDENNFKSVKVLLLPGHLEIEQVELVNWTCFCDLKDVSLLSSKRLFQFRTELATHQNRFKLYITCRYYSGHHRIEIGTSP